jgi:plastocyanin
MKRMLYVVFAALVLAIPATSSARTDATINVKITQGAFAPASVTINTGDTVTWTNNTNGMHQVVSDDGVFVSPVLTAGQSYSFTFKAAGKYVYHDALHPALKGTTTVTGPPPEVTLSAGTAIVTYGGSTTISGKVSSGDASASVVISSRTVGSSSTQQVATVTTGTGGTFTTTVKPSMQTTYTATWKGTTSQSVTVAVRPKIAFAHYGKTRFVAKVRTATSLEGHLLYLQRNTGVGWITVKRVRLGPTGGAIFAAPHLRGYRTYRVYLTSAQAGNGYLDAASSKVRQYFRR